MADAPRAKEAPRLFYGYVLVAIAVGIQIIAWGTFNSFSVFFNALLVQFEWSRAVLSGAASLSQMVVGIGAIFFGNWNDRFGPRLLIAAGGLIAGAGYILMSTVNEVWQFYLFYGLIVGLGFSGTDIILLSTTARWFVRRRGMMSGIVKMGTGIGVLVMPIWLTFLISSFQWRAAYIITGIVVACCLVVGSWFLVKDPSRKRQLPDGQDPGSKLNEPAGLNMSLREAMHTRRFFTLCVAYFTVLFCTCIVVVHIVPFVVDRGHTAATGALVLAAIGGASIAGRLTLGTIGDRVGSKRALLLGFSVFVLAFIWLQFAQQLWELFLFALLYGFAHGGFYALVSPVVAEFFGLRSHGLIFGTVIFVGSVGGALGPVVAGLIFDITASYHYAFLLLLLFSAVGLVAVLASGQTARKAAAPGATGP